MIYNDEKVEIEKVEAFFIIRKNSKDTYIKIIAKDGEHISFNFNNEEFNPQKLEKNKVIDLKKYLWWDVKLITNETYYLFDLIKDDVNLTRIDDNLFHIEVHIENPDMIYSPLSPKASFNNLIINWNFSFIYED